MQFGACLRGSEELPPYPSALADALSPSDLIRQFTILSCLKVSLSSRHRGGSTRQYIFLSFQILAVYRMDSLRDRLAGKPWTIVGLLVALVSEPLLLFSVFVLTALDSIGRRVLCRDCYTTCSIQSSQAYPRPEDQRSFPDPIHPSYAGWYHGQNDSRSAQAVWRGCPYLARVRLKDRGFAVQSEIISWAVSAGFSLCRTLYSVASNG